MGASRTDRPQPPASPAMETYFRGLRQEAEAAHAVATQARALGFDPAAEVEVVLAEDLAARVEAQVEIPGLAARLRELDRMHPNREVVALEAAKEVAMGRFTQFTSKAQAIDKAVRVGLSVITEGVLVAPLEGIAEVRLGQNQDGTDYVDLYFAGPIRAAGGTGQALGVLIADVVRRDLGVGRYQPTSAEVERYQEEVPAYKRAANLQYEPTTEEIALIVRNCPVCINGEGTEQVEITGHRDLPRVETNRLRGGACLVIAEGLCLKAPKIAKHVKALGLADWGFIDQFITKLKAADEAAGDEAGEEDVPVIEPSHKFMKDLIAGRPVFAHPSRPGAFRLRYGRAPTAGLASTAISPVTMHALNDFLAVGTQIKVERPGKGTIATPCDTLEGPTLLLTNGDLVRVDTLDAWRKVDGRVAQITDLGEILVPYGEFLENNHVLADAGYVHEWWVQELEAAAGSEAAASWRSSAPDYEAAVALSRKHGVPLHPDHTLFWHDLEAAGYGRLREVVAASGRLEEGTLVLPQEKAVQEVLITLNALHVRREGRLRVGFYGRALADGLGLEAGPDGNLSPREDVGDADAPVLSQVASAMGLPVRAKAPTRIGARMGRPEKADVRKMSPPVHALYPLGNAGGNQRKLADAAKVGSVESEVGRRRCRECGRDSYRLRCLCGGGTTALKDPPAARSIKVKEDLTVALGRLGMRSPPDLVKGVIGLMSAGKFPEPLEKGILRGAHGVYTFKDGTVRFDMTDAPLTHFRPRDLGTPVARLRELGYEADAYGEPLSRDDQLVEMRVQDVVVPRSAGVYFLAAARFVDDLLTKFYGLKPFYDASRPDDLVGRLAVGLAPHTSAGVLVRIIGFTTAQVGWGHPFFHAAKRRNADGDEDALILLMDCFLNFSKGFVPDRRGGLMDLPLVLTTRIDPREIDSEAHNVDAGWSYPLAFYEATQRHAHPKDVVDLVDIVKGRLGTPAQYEGLGVTHAGSSMQQGPLSSSYKTLGAMAQKMEAQLDLADRVRAVDAADVADRVISTHLLPDLLGNLKAFTRQKVRCTKCNAKYRRVPLTGRCTKVQSRGKACGNVLTLTVHEKSVKKYLKVIEELDARYELPAYTRQRIVLARRFLEDAFAPEKFVTPALGEFSA